MPTARLNVDVLAIVSEFLITTGDVLSFGLTCSFLHPIATRRLLSMRPIYLTERKSVQKFHSFLFADAATRGPHVRALCILNRRPPPVQTAEQANLCISSLLAEIVTVCPQLAHVSISLGYGSVYDRPLLAAIAALQTLRSLAVSGWSTNALHLLREVSSRIRTLSVSSFLDSDPASLEKFLPRFAQTLEELDLHYLRPCSNLVDHVPGSLGFFRKYTQYPAVRSLSIGPFVEQPVLDHLQHLFPALEETLRISMLDSTIDTRAREEIRAANRRAQEGSPRPPHVWKKLNRVVCTPLVFHLLALSCPIRHLMLDLDNYAREDSLRHTVEALRENPVPRLKLTLRCRRGTGMFDGVFSPELAASLSRLTLCLVYDNERDPAAVTQLLWSDLLNTLVSALRPLHSVTHLHVVVSCKIVQWQRPTVSASQSSGASATGTNKSIPYPPESFADAVRGSAFDFEGTAAALVRALPESLQYVFLTTRGAFFVRDLVVRNLPLEPERWDVHRAWRVADGTDGGPGTRGASISPDGIHDEDVNPPSGRLVELHKDVAATIFRNEELDLSGADESLLFQPIGVA